MKTIAAATLTTILALGTVSGCSTAHHHASSDPDLPPHAHPAHPPLGDDGHGAAAGGPGEAASVDRRVPIEMNDAMRYVPATIEVGSGETIAFDVVNVGRLRHEFVLGSARDIAGHREAMRSMPGMTHDEPGSLSLGAGETGTLVRRFGEAGDVDIACLQPGHHEAGMKGSVKVRGS